MNIKVKNMVRSKIVFLIVVMVFHCSNISAQKPADSKPNIIFILADDLGYGDIGCYGQQKIATPNIDALAKNGMKFTQYYSGSTVCAPARSTFMTGLHTGHTAVRGNVTIKPEGQFPLPASVVTLPMKLKEQGYATAAFGKWSLGFIGTSGDPQKKGFDHFYGYNCQTLAHDYYPDHLWDDDKRVDLSGNPYSHIFYSADIIHEKAIAFIKAQQKDQPFFAYLPYTLPHADLTVPHDQLYEKYKKQFNELPLSIVRASDTAGGKPFEPYPHAAYAAMVSRLDLYVGEIVSLINKKKMADNTIIIFTSDNGPHKEDRGDPAFFNSNGGFKGIKRDLYEGGIREPLIVQWKGTVKAGAVNNEAVIAMWDFFPTIMNILKQPANNLLDGISFLPALQGNIQPQHEYLYWELHEAGGKQAVRLGKWKGIKLNVTANENSAIELYDIVADPGELNNVAGQNPAIVKQIDGIIRQSHIMDRSWPLLPGEK